MTLLWLCQRGCGHCKARADPAEAERRRRAEEERRLAEEQRLAEERRAAEQRRRAEERRLAEERRAAEKLRQLAEYRAQVAAGFALLKTLSNSWCYLCAVPRTGTAGIVGADKLVLE